MYRPRPTIKLSHLPVGNPYPLLLQSYFCKASFWTGSHSCCSITRWMPVQEVGISSHFAIQSNLNTDSGSFSTHLLHLFTEVQVHWLHHCPMNNTDKLPFQDFGECCFLDLERTFPRYPTSFRFLPKGHLFKPPHKNRVNLIIPPCQSALVFCAALLITWWFIV